MYLMIKAGTRPMDTFYAKYTDVFHMQNLADVWSDIPILQTLDNNLTRFIIQKKQRRRTILGSNAVQSVIIIDIDSLYKVMNLILPKSSVV